VSTPELLSPLLIAIALAEAIQLGDWLIVDKLHLDRQGRIAHVLGWVVYVLALILLISIPLALRNVV